MSNTGRFQPERSNGAKAFRHPVKLFGMPAIGTSDLWKMFEWAHGWLGASKRARHQQIEKWLDAVYADLNELSMLWMELSANRQVARDREIRAGRILASGVSLDYLKVRKVRRQDTGIRFTKSEMVISGSQQIASSRLREFYDAASRVLPPDNSFRETFLDSLASVLLARARAREAFDQISDEQGPESTKELLASMNAAARELQENTAILQAAITTLKALPERSGELFKFR
jgi:hypothetical protein